MKNLIERINTYEAQIGLTDDAVIHKAMQEGLELVEALGHQDLQEIKGEVGDAISNILSAHYRVSACLPTLTKESINSTSTNLAIQLGKRNDTIQKYRGIYSRNYSSDKELNTSTSTTINTIISLSEQALEKDINITDLINQQIQKFGERVNLYSNHINLNDYIDTIKDFPKEGIMFKDVGPLLNNPQAFQYTTEQLSQRAKDADVIVGLDARGFIFGAAVARFLNKPFVMIRKKGKLPGKVIEEKYELEYGENIQAIQIDSIQPGQKVAIIDDLLATGGTAACAAQLIEKAGGIVQGCHFVINLTDLLGCEKLKNYTISSLLEY